MSDQGENLGTGRWMCCYWHEKYEALGDLPRQAGLIAPGVLMLPPPVEDLTFEEGLWTALNEELGTLFDVAEEEDLPVDSLPAAASITLRFAERVRAAGSRSYRVVASQRVTPDQAPLIAELPAPVLSRYLQALVDFLIEAAAQKKPVTISL